jgi:very-short-patch-repair endonuclease
MDKLVAQRFKFLYPKADIVSNVIIDGFRLDLSFPNIKLNVELDGPSHRSLRSSPYIPTIPTLHL